MPLCLIPCIIKYGSRVKWSNPEKGLTHPLYPSVKQLMQRKPSGHPQLSLSTLFIRNTFHLLLFKKLWIWLNYNIYCVRISVRVSFHGEVVFFLEYGIQVTLLKHESSYIHFRTNRWKRYEPYYTSTQQTMCI